MRDLPGDINELCQAAELEIRVLAGHVSPSRMEQLEVSLVAARAAAALLNTISFGPSQEQALMLAATGKSRQPDHEEVIGERVWRSRAHVTSLADQGHMLKGAHLSHNPTQADILGYAMNFWDNDRQSQLMGEWLGVGLQITRFWGHMKVNAQDQREPATFVSGILCKEWIDKTIVKKWYLHVPAENYEEREWEIPVEAQSTRQG